MRLVFPELFVVLIIQLVSAGPLAPLEITAITEEQALRAIHGTFPSLAAANPRAMTLSLLRCSPTCDKCAAPTPRREGPPPHKDRDLHPTWIGTPTPHGEGDHPPWDLHPWCRGTLTPHIEQHPPHI